MTRIDASSFKLKEIESIEDIKKFWGEYDILTIPQKKKGKYLSGFACSDRCIEASQRLRYQIFNVELGEGLAASEKTGLDQDEFDDQMTHLVLIEEKTNELIGTYRMQTVAQAEAGVGIYSARQYVLDDLKPYFDKLVEVGRACLAEDHRSMATLLLLWLGIGTFMRLTGTRYLFGCCSLTTQDIDDGWRAKKNIRKRNAFHESILLPATKDFSCGNPEREHDDDLGEPIQLSKLFNAYLRLGCHVISDPAIDREFGTIDFLIMLDAVTNVKMSIVDVVDPNKEKK